MNEKFSELLKLLSLANIRFVDSHETVLQDLAIAEGEEVRIKTEQSFAKDDPVVADGSVVFRPRYTFIFSAGGKDFFKTEYILFVSFGVSDEGRFRELFAENDVSEMFLKRQMNRTLWSILRGVVMDAFNRHSLKPIPLPWIL